MIAAISGSLAQNRKLNILEPQNKIRVIELWPMTDDCYVCGEEVLMEYGLPAYESDIVPNDWPGEWGGHTACKRCYGMFSDIREPLSVHKARKILEEESMAYGHA